jgi:hypothetical protein
VVAALPLCGEVSAQSASPRWTFQELLQPPTAGELREVDASWERKSWTVADSRLVATTTVPVGSIQFVARLYTYTLNGSDRCGAVLVPPGAEPRTRAALIDIGDIRWDYPDRDLTRGLYLARILGDRASEFVVLVPCTRGTGLRIGEHRVEAGGDRRDAWEGAAEDAMSFLSVAMAATVEIDTARVGVYGYSRGGGVALIVGQRDTRVKAVLDFAGPTDWFTAMETSMARVTCT